MELGLSLSLAGQRQIPMSARVKAALKRYDAHLYLPGPGVPVLGPELIPSNNLNGFSDSSRLFEGQVTHTDTGFTTTSNAVGVTKSVLVVGKTYRLSISGTASQELTSNTADGLIPTVRTQVGVGFGEFVFIADGPVLYLRLTTAGSVSGISISVKEVTGYTNTIQGFSAGNYVESTGVTPGSVDGLVGLSIDAAGSVGAELVTNGDGSGVPAVFGANMAFYQGAGSASGGAYNVNATVAASTGHARFIVSAGSVGKLYRIEFDIIVPASFISVIAKQMINGVTSTIKTITERGTTVRVSYVSSQIITASDRPLLIEFQNNTSTTDAFALDNISVREVSGIHASQVTQGYKPWLRRGIMNLLTWSDDRSNAAWTKDGVTASGSKLVESATTAQHRALNGTAVTLVADASRTYAAIVDPAERSIVRMSDNLSLGATYNLSTGAITSVSGGVTASMATLSNGRKLLVFSNTTSNTSGRLVFNLADSSGATTYAGNGTSGIYLYSGGLFQGALTAQQILDAGGIPLTTNAAASSANGKYYWQFDGSDDTLVMTFPAGWESATIIDSRSTGQVTQTAQNIVGTYNISTSTYGRIFCRLAPSAADLALLQKFANILAGVTI